MKPTRSECRVGLLVFVPGERDGRVLKLVQWAKPYDAVLICLTFAELASADRLGSLCFVSRYGRKVAL